MDRHNEPLTQPDVLHSVSDDELLRQLADLIRDSRRVEADLVAHIGEVDRRRLYARFAVPSMFAYCTDLLQLSEAEAYLRITAARASRQHPMLLSMLADGRLHLTAIALLAPHLTAENRPTLLSRAAHLSKKRIQELLAELYPRPDVSTTVRKLPEPRPVPSSAPPFVDVAPCGDSSMGLNSQAAMVASTTSRPSAAVSDGRVPRPAPVSPPSSRLCPDGVRQQPRATVEPIAPRRYRVQFTASQELRDKLARLQALMRTTVPDGDLAAVIEAAVTEKLERLGARRFATTSTPRETKTSRPRNTEGKGAAASTRHLPAAIRRAVGARDEGRCRYVDELGRRCTERQRLEFHHRRPLGYGGEHSVQNVALLCRAHNGHMARVDYGVLSVGSRNRPPASTPVRAPAE